MAERGGRGGEKKNERTQTTRSVLLHLLPQHPPPSRKDSNLSPHPEPRVTGCSMWLANLLLTPMFNKLTTHQQARLQITWRARALPSGERWAWQPSRCTLTTRSLSLSLSALPVRDGAEVDGADTRERSLTDDSFNYEQPEPVCLALLVSLCLSAPAGGLWKVSPAAVETRFVADDKRYPTHACPFWSPAVPLRAVLLCLLSMFLPKCVCVCVSVVEYSTATVLR